MEIDNRLKKKIVFLKNCHSIKLTNLSGIKLKNFK